MQNIYCNLNNTIFLFMVSHEQTVAQMLLKEPVYDILSKGGSKKQITRAVAKQKAIKYISQIAEYRSFKKERLVYSVSHSRDNTVLLASYCPKVFSCGVDIETVDVSRRIRPFMIDYLERSSYVLECAVSPLLLSIIVFCCMESIYKTLSARWLMTFSIDDYRLEKVSRDFCIFYFVGRNEEIVGKRMMCRYYLHGDTVVATTFMNYQFFLL
ncbi:hypothetical protein [Pantoea ananatis]|uniref:hypothetical protein n=1 Tax=Pantoea ananas TaxID=553 RepID=UPI001B30DC70|nr:hypothetical protein [Pantoea ananatis]